jgi:hypothetical protein
LTGFLRAGARPLLVIVDAVTGTPRTGHARVGRRTAFEKVDRKGDRSLMGREQRLKNEV